MQCVRTDLNKVLCGNTYNTEHVPVYELRDAESQLKAHKRDGCTYLESDHIINAGDNCQMHVTQLLNAIISHGALPDRFLNSTVLPIPKARNVEFFSTVS